MKKQEIQVMLITIVAMLLMLCHVVQAQQLQALTPVSADDARIARLSGLARVWGAAKYFHPYLATREIDWDRALIETIPKVNAAKAPQEYTAAINSMLAALGDKTTRAQIAVDKPKSENHPSVIEAKDPVLLQDGVLLIDILAFGKAISGGNNRINEFIAKTGQLIPQAKAVVIDMRSLNAVGDFASFGIDYYFRTILPMMLDRNIPLSSVRYRMHNGYAPQIGGSSGGYYSALVTTAPGTLAGNNKVKTPQMVFLVDENSPMTEVLGGLQAANLAFVIQEGTTEATSSEATTITLPENVEVTMRTAELVNPDGTLGFGADMIAPKREAMREARRMIAENKFISSRPRTSSANATQISQKEKTYADMEFPSAEYRLLALFRFWNVINYFYPYKDLLDEKWETVLPKFIPQFESNKDAADYQLTVREVAAEVQDSHTGVGNANAAAERLGTYLPPVLAGYIEKQTVVIKVLEGNVPVKVGDVVLAIDGEPIEKRREYLAHYTAASTPQALMQSVHGNLFRGQKASVVKLRVLREGGQIREVEIARTLSRIDPKLSGAYARTTPIVAVLPSGFGYVDLARLPLADVDKMFELIKNTTATIFDMRGYPNGTAWAVAPRLTEKRSPVAALFSRPILEATSLSDIDSASGVNYSFEQKLPEAKGDIYKGKVVMLINQDAISQAEHTAMLFEAARPDIVFIGTPTMGANGDVTVTVLPGNLAVSFTGHDVRHADGRQLQRVGIQPTISVAPTIRGTIEGRDEILEAAIKYLQENVRK